jgi:hypothetical protein
MLRTRLISAGANAVRNVRPAAVVRLFPDGRVDPSWDGRTPEALYMAAAEVVIPLADGRVLAASAGGAVRFLGTGEIDRSFGAGGRLATGHCGNVLDAFLDPDGTLLIAGGDRCPAKDGFTFTRSRGGRLGLPTPSAWGSGVVGQLGSGGTADRPRRDGGRPHRRGLGRRRPVPHPRPSGRRQRLGVRLERGRPAGGRHDRRPDGAGAGRRPRRCRVGVGRCRPQPGRAIRRHAAVAVPGLGDVRSVSAGVFHSLAVQVDGSVRAWGWNGTGALGTGDTVNRPAPTPVPVSGVAVGAAGGLHTVVS